MARRELSSGDALVVFEPGGRIVDWNGPAEQLTGIPASAALYRPCWEVLGAIDCDGSPVCHADCVVAQAMIEGTSFPCRELLIRTKDGHRRVLASTLQVHEGSEPLCAHLLTAARELSPEESALLRDLNDLTKRQKDVLAFVLQGIPAKVIAVHLELSVRTVRNYIREILLTLGCRTQLEALAKLSSLRGSQVNAATG
jgi:DNA-binding CsgD family transcriptional regulator